MNSLQGTIITRTAETLAFLTVASVLYILPVVSQRSNAVADYLVVEHSNQLLIYNKYQQRITQQEKKAFVPFVPLRVLDSCCVLNDNYTQCMKVELNGNIFYLIKNNKTTLMGNENLGLNQIYWNAALLEDTVQLMANGDAVLISPDYTQRFLLQKSEKLVRYFQDGDLTYIHPFSAPLRFGWARLAGIVRELPSQEMEQNNIDDTGIQGNILERIELKFKEVNELLAYIFSYFNKQSNQKKSVPQWHSVESEKSITYMLIPQLYRASFPQSDQYLERDLDNILLGTVYTISYTPGKIEIQHK